MAWNEAPSFLTSSALDLWIVKLEAREMWIEGFSSFQDAVVQSEAILSTALYII